MITVADAAAWLGITTLTPELTALLTALIPRAQARIERESSRYFGTSAVHTEYLNGNGIRFLRFSQPVESGTPTVEHESTPGIWDTVPADDYQIIGTELRHDVGWIQGTRNYRINYNRGFAPASTDQDFLLAQQAVRDVITAWFQSHDTGGAQSESLGPYSVSLAAVDSVNVAGSAALRKLKGFVYA